jgi:hypothetical protein
MTAADGIQKFGFRRWYERQLIECHVYLVTGFLSMIMVFACFEDFSLRAPGFKPILMLGLITVGLLLCAVSFRRYLSMLLRAQQLAEQSTCERCGSYGRLKVMALVPAVESPEEGGLAVQCRQCGNEWTMHPAGKP